MFLTTKVFVFFFFLRNYFSLLLSSNRACFLFFSQMLYVDENRLSLLNYFNRIFIEVLYVSRLSDKGQNLGNVNKYVKLCYVSELLSTNVKCMEWFGYHSIESGPQFSCMVHFDTRCGMYVRFQTDFLFFQSPRHELSRRSRVFFRTWSLANYRKGLK